MSDGMHILRRNAVDATGVSARMLARLRACMRVSF